MSVWSWVWDFVWSWVWDFVVDLHTGFSCLTGKASHQADCKEECGAWGRWRSLIFIAFMAKQMAKSMAKQIWSFPKMGIPLFINSIGFFHKPSIIGYPLDYGPHLLGSFLWRCRRDRSSGAGGGHHEDLGSSEHHQTLWSSTQMSLQFPLVGWF